MGSETEHDDAVEDLVRECVRAANPTLALPVPPPTATPAALRARAGGRARCTKHRRRLAYLSRLMALIKAGIR